MAFRNDINFLRAFAIGSVIAYHFKTSLAPGGYLGVDVFFVISGFLITSLLLRQMEAETFTFVRFYQNRVARIFPALIFLCLCLLIFGYVFVDPIGYQDIGKEITSALLFVSNLYFYEQSGYFDIGARSKFLLHTWSLSLEWQFYLLYPIAFFGAFKWAKGKSPYTLPGLLLIVSLVSFGIALWQALHAPSLNYYMLQSRVWEFLLGGGLVFLPQITLSQTTKLIGVAVAMSILVMSDLTLKSTGQWPSVLTLLPVGATLAILVIGNDDNGLYNNPVTRWLGEASYSLYIWHWPILVGLHYFELYGPVFLGLGAGLTLAMGAISYRFIETPLRKLLSEPRQWRAICMMAGVIPILAATGFSLKMVSGLPNRSGGDPIVYAAYIDAAKDWGFPQTCRSRASPAGADVCDLGHGLHRRILVIGDSFAEQLYPHFEHLVDLNPGLSVHFVTQTGCPPIPAVERRGDGHCQSRVEEGFTAAETGHYDVVVLASIWAPYFDGISDACLQKRNGCQSLGGDKPSRAVIDTAFLGLQARLRTIAARGSQVVIFEPTPITEGGPDYPEAMLKDIYLRKSIAGIDHIDRSDFTRYTATIRTRLVDVARNAGGQVYDPTNDFCNAKICPTVVSGQPVFKDALHITASYMREKPLPAFDDLLQSGPQQR